MNEIRFSPIQRTVEPQREAVAEEGQKRGGGVVKKVLKVILLIIALCIVGASIFMMKDKIVSLFVKEKPYGAVFLTNGQVYFGKVTKNNDKEIVLNDVYYLQVGAGAQAEAVNALSQTKFNLVKLGNELHGPTDELFINREQVIFYEYLREDSKVVSSIKSQKQ